MTWEEAIKQGLCATCKEKPIDEEFHPCCSERCQDAWDWFCEYGDMG